MMINPRQFVSLRNVLAILASAAAILLAPALTRDTPRKGDTEATGDNHPAAFENSGFPPVLFNRHSRTEVSPVGPNGMDLISNGGEWDRSTMDGPGQEQYGDRALPRRHIDPEQSVMASQAFTRLASQESMTGGAWQFLGPTNPVVPAAVTYTGRSTTVSGRVTALAIGSSCTSAGCTLCAGTAGGGVWMTRNALATVPTWTPTSGIPSNAIGSVAIDPTDPSGNTIYAGTGEPNGSSDSEAGVGLYKSTDGGSSWSLVPGSLAVSKDRSISSIAIDPQLAGHLLIGTAMARHGMASVGGGRWTPPKAPKIGLYESTNGGATFTLAFSLPSDKPNSGTTGGGDYYRGGVTKVLLDRTGLSSSDPTRVYASFFDYGLYRRDPATEGDTSFHQVFASAGAGSVSSTFSSRTEFALAPNGSNLRIYVGDIGTGAADFYRVDDANVPGPTLSAEGANIAWTKLSSSTKGTPGFSSYNFCGGQCWYDMVVASPPGRPDTIYIGGAMQYGEIFTGNQPSNGRTIQRSTDAGVTFTDMTNDAQSPALGMHPDQHAAVFSPSNPDIAFFGSDGGIVRTSGGFVDASGQCSKRGLSGEDLADCRMWLKSVPTRITSANSGLATLQFQSVSIDPGNPRNALLGGTQDNGTWAFKSGAGSKSWFESIGGDGGQSGFDAGNSQIRMHTYYGAQPDVNFRGSETTGWDWVGDPLGSTSSGESASFYVPLIGDPHVSGTWFIGLEHVWRTTDNGGPRAYLDTHCNEYTGDFSAACGDWAPLGGPKGPDQPGNLAGSFYGADKSGGYVVAIARTAQDNGTLWAATRMGRLFISTNASAAATSVVFKRVDTASQPNRFISGIIVDPENANHIYVSYSGYDAYTRSTPGHVFSVLYDSVTKKAKWTNMSYQIGDQPITGIALDTVTGDLYASTDWGVLRLASGSKAWTMAGSGLPPVAVYGLTIAPAERVLYAATHGRSIWWLALP